jgi:hypothetical protein
MTFRQNLYHLLGVDQWSSSKKYSTQTGNEKLSTTWPSISRILGKKQITGRYFSGARTRTLRVRGGKFTSRFSGVSAVMACSVPDILKNFLYISVRYLHQQGMFAQGGKFATRNSALADSRKDLNLPTKGGSRSFSFREPSGAEEIAGSPQPVPPRPAV